MSHFELLRSYPEELDTLSILWKPVFSPRCLHTAFLCHRHLAPQLAVALLPSGSPPRTFEMRHYYHGRTDVRRTDAFLYLETLGCIMTRNGRSRCQRARSNFKCSSYLRRSVVHRYAVVKKITPNQCPREERAWAGGACM